MDSEKSDLQKSPEVTSDEALPLVDVKRMIRKVDFRLLGIMMFTYATQFMDKLALSAGSGFGLRRDLHLHGQQYSWCSSIFYFGFMLGNFATARTVNLLPMGKFLAATIFVWGLILALSGAAVSFAGLATARFFLGIMESAVSPSFVYITSVWWPQELQASRTNLWFAGNDIGGVINSLISFGLGHAHGKLAPWRYIFITYGCIAVVFAFAMLYFMPDSPQKAKFLTQDEKQYYQDNMTTAHEDTKWDWAQVKYCLLDRDYWLIMLSMAASIMPNSGVISYGFIIIESFGYTPIQTTLINLALSVVTWFFITSIGYLAGKLKNARCYMIWFTMCFSIAGGVMIFRGNAKGVKLAGYFLVDAQPTMTPLVLGMAASNFKGKTRRSFVNSSAFIVYCACNIGGPQLFRAGDAPKYTKAFLSWIICYCLSGLFALLMRISWSMRNKEMEKREKSEEALEDDGEQMEFLDPAFRYTY